MAKEKISFESKMHDLRLELGFIQKIDCSKEDNKKYTKMLKDGIELPEGIHKHSDLNEFYTYYEPKLSPEEKAEYIAFRQLAYIKTIKNCVAFFTVLAIISLIAAIIFFNNLVGAINYF